MRCRWCRSMAGSIHPAGQPWFRLPARLAARPTLNKWLRKAAVDSGQRAGVTTDTAERLKALERENQELRQANEILHKAFAYFAPAEIDRPFKR